MPPISSKYIENAFQKGYTEEQIKRSLLAQGISEVDIASAIDSYNKQQITPPVSAPTPPQPQPQVRPPQFTPPPTRVQYQTGSPNRWIIAVVIVLILSGAGAGIYYYFDSIKTMIGGIVGGFYGEEEEPLQVYQPASEPNITPEVSPAPAAPVVSPPPEIITPQSGDDIKISAIGDLKASADAYYKQNGVYPQTVNNSNPDIFYCYRKNGGHYILGAALEFGNSVLSADLDGSYNCGDTVKECADPVYCVAP